MTYAPRPRRGAALAARGAERRELERRGNAVAEVDAEDARRRLTESLAAARMAALELRYVIVAAEITGIQRLVEQKP